MLVNGRHTLSVNLKSPRLCRITTSKSNCSTGRKKCQMLEWICELNIKGNTMQVENEWNKPIFNLNIYKDTPLVQKALKTRLHISQTAFHLLMLFFSRHEMDNVM